MKKGKGKMNLESHHPLNDPTKVQKTLMQHQIQLIKKTIQPLTLKMMNPSENLQKNWKNLPITVINLFPDGDA